MVKRALRPIFLVHGAQNAVSLPRRGYSILTRTPWESFWKHLEVILVHELRKIEDEGFQQTISTTADSCLLLPISNCPVVILVVLVVFLVVLRVVFSVSVPAVAWPLLLPVLQPTPGPAKPPGPPKPPPGLPKRRKTYPFEAETPI